MAHTAFQAYYFSGCDNCSAPVRTELIEADSEDEAATIATSHLGPCKRVDILPPRWLAQHSRVILAGETLNAKPIVH